LEAWAKVRLNDLSWAEPAGVKGGFGNNSEVIATLIILVVGLTRATVDGEVLKPKLSDIVAPPAATWIPLVPPLPNGVELDVIRAAVNVVRLREGLAVTWKTNWLLRLSAGTFHPVALENVNPADRGDPETDI